MSRYKIYIEGSAWSVSEKYILACDSVTLLVKPHYYDFFTRGLLPAHHYWPVREHDKCRSIKFAVDWGNSHIQKVHCYSILRFTALELWLRWSWSSIGTLLIYDET